MSLPLQSVRQLVAGFVLCCISVVFSSVPVYGQAVTGSLVGTVTDVSRAVITAAEVVITETQTDVRRSVLTNESGTFTAPNLPAGTYSLTVEVPGFRRMVRENVGVLVNTTVRVDLELQPGLVTETVSVTAEVPALQTDRADTGRKIETKQLSDMPLGFNRNFQGLLALVPGVNKPTRIHSEFYNPQDALSAWVNGQSRLANSVQIEGVDNNFRTNRLTVLIPPIEAIAAVDVTTSGWEAELGRAGGAVTNLTLKSGTNDLHGSLYYFNRVSRLAARNVFANSKAPTVYNQYGFTLGGPVVRNKTFFFGDFQGIKDRRGDLHLVTMPIMPFRNGDLSSGPTTIYDPSTGQPDGTGRDPFINSQIPASRISPVSRRILDLVPAPLSPGFNTNWQTTNSRKKDTNSFDIKADHHARAQSRFAVRYSRQQMDTEQPPIFGLAGGPSQGGGPSGTAGDAVFTSHSAAVNFTEIFSPTTIGTFRVGFSRYRNDAQQSDFGTNASDEIGIPGVNVDPKSSGLASIRINGFSAPMVGYSDSLPWLRAETGYYYVGSLTKVQGNHTIKFGGEFRRSRDVADLGFGIGARSNFFFTAGPTALNGDPQNGFANSFAGFLLDAPNSINRGLRGAVPDMHETSVFSYVQDKWQVTRKLTIDIGLRHEVYFPATAHSPGGMSTYDPATNTLRVAGIGTVPSDLGVETYAAGFLPRVGFALRLNDKTVLRAGYGAGLTTQGQEPIAYFNFPFRSNVEFTAPNTFSTAGSMGAGLPSPEPFVVPEDGLVRNPPLDQTYRFVPLDYKQGRLQSWNVALQRSLPANFTFEVAYVGNHGSRIDSARNINAGLIPGAGAAGQPLNEKFGIRAGIDNNYYPVGSDYHSLQTKLDRRFSNGFLLTTAYTYSKAIDYSGNNGGLFIDAIPELNRARNDLNPTHIFVQSYIYEIPFGPNKPWLQSGVGRWILGDWQLNGIFTAQAGRPLNITTSSAQLNAPGNGNRPDVSGKPEIFGDVGRGQLWFDTSRFSAPPPATYGNVGRSILSGPGLVNLDFSVFRNFPLTERFELEFRYESLNFTNTPHFNNPNGNFTSGGFGQVTSALQDQRLNQFALKLTF